MDEEDTSVKTLREIFIRWQGVTIDERGKTINLFIAACFATLGFVITQLVDKDFRFRNDFSRIFIVWGSFGIIISIILFIWLVLNRLKGFRITTKIAREKQKRAIAELENLREGNKKIDALTHLLFSISFITFAVSEFFITTGFVIQVWDKIN
jgi:hypothetical protein